MGDIAGILEGVDKGTPQASEALLKLVYTELRRLASSKISRETDPQTLQPTALVHEAWLRLGGNRGSGWENRRHFFGAAAEAMQQILIERARRRRAVRHGGGQTRVSADLLERVSAEVSDDRLVAVSEALSRLASRDPGKAELVKLRYFVGLTIDEAAATIGISGPMAKRWWSFARAWLARELRKA